MGAGVGSVSAMHKQPLHHTLLVGIALTNASLNLIRGTAFQIYDMIEGFENSLVVLALSLLTTSPYSLIRQVLEIRFPGYFIYEA